MTREEQQEFLSRLCVGDVIKTNYLGRGQTLSGYISVRISDISVTTELRVRGIVSNTDDLHGAFPTVGAGWSLGDGPPSETLYELVSQMDGSVRQLGPKTDFAAWLTGGL